MAYNFPLLGHETKDVIPFECLRTFPHIQEGETTSFIHNSQMTQAIQQVILDKKMIALSSLH